MTLTEEQRGPIVAESVSPRESTRGEVRKVKRSASEGKVKGSQQDRICCPRAVSSDATSPLACFLHLLAAPGLWYHVEASLLGDFGPLGRCSVQASRSPGQLQDSQEFYIFQHF